MIAFKNRVLDESKPVDVYRCLTRKGKWFSVRQSGKVVGHTENLILKDCQFHINKSGKARALLTQQRNVHAWVKGLITTSEDFPNSFGFLIDYKPFENKGFVIPLLDKEITFVKSCYFYDGKLFTNQIT